MTVYLTPDTKQTAPGTRRYRLWDIEHCDWAEFAGKGVSLVTCSRWSVSYSHSDAADGWTLRVFDVSSMPDKDIVYHDLNGEVYATQEQARHAAFNHGLLAFMEYLDPPRTY